VFVPVSPPRIPNIHSFVWCRRGWRMATCILSSVGVSRSTDLKWQVIVPTALCYAKPLQLLDVCEGLMYLHSEGFVHGGLNLVPISPLSRSPRINIKPYDRKMSSSMVKKGFAWRISVSQVIQDSRNSIRLGARLPARWFTWPQNK
jgi:hypothetical protein